MKPLVPLLLVLVVLLGLSAGVAGAVSCVTDQAMTPAEVVGAGLRSGSQAYDAAVVARVESETTSQNLQSAVVELFGVYGDTSAPAMATVTFGGPGVAAGSIDSFEVGTAYFIPIVALGPDGEPNYTTSCDPIRVVDDPDTTSVDLAVVAEGAGVEFSLPAQGSGGSGATVTVVFLALMVALFWWTGRRLRSNRQGITGTDSDPRQRPGPPR